MAQTSTVVIHFYKSGQVAVEDADDFLDVPVTTEVLMFCLMVSRTLLESRKKANEAEGKTLIKWLDLFRGMAVGIHDGTLDAEAIQAVLAPSNQGRVLFTGVLGRNQLIATLRLRNPLTGDHRFDVEERGRFGLFGASKHLAYREAMVCLWAFLMKRRGWDLRYCEALNLAGFLVGKAFFDRELSEQTEADVIKLAIQKIVHQLQTYGDNFEGEEQYAVDTEKVVDEANSGDAMSQHFLGWLYEHGRVVVQDFTEALKWYRKAAESEEPKAQSSLGDMYYSGKGVPQDYSQAGKWYLKAAESGYTTAQAKLGLMYEHGLGFTKDYSAALSWYKKAAEKGSEIAQTQLGFMYGNGWGVQRDYSVAARWFRQAAEQGYSLAQVHLAMAYQEGVGIPQDYNEAAKWFGKAAAQGDPKAKYGLGYLTFQGFGVPKDFNEGVRWISEAAEEGEVQAQYGLGFILEKIGEITDAVQWYRIAAKNGHEEAQQRLRTLT